MKSIFSTLTLLLIILQVYSNAQWVQQTLPGDVDITLGIDFINQNHGLLGGWHFNFGGEIFGNAFFTTDSGTNWFEASFPDSMRVIVGVQMLSDLVAYGAGAYNILTAQSSTRSNRNQNLSPWIKNYYNQIGMDFSEQEEYRGYFIETTDGGLSWHPKGSFEDSVYYLVGIYFIDQQNGYVIASGPGASSSAALKTTDGGNSWEYVIPFQDQFYIKDIHFFSSLGFLVYENTFQGSVYITSTTDGGMTWTPPLQVGLLSASKVSYKNESTILISGTDNQLEGAVVWSTNSGADWQLLRDYDNQHYLSGVCAVWNTNVFLVYGSYQPTGTAYPFVDVSLNGGSNWNYSQLTQFQDFTLFTSKMVDEQRWYLTGTQSIQMGFVLFTDNSGGVPVELISFTADPVENGVQLEWTTASDLNNLGFELERKAENEEWRMVAFVEGKGTTTETSNYSFTDDLFGVTASKLCYRLKQVDYNGTLEYSNEIEVIRTPGEFSLEQNYPNPFNPTTKIRFTISDLRFTILKVYDVLGNEIATLVNEELPAGEYEGEFNPASGNRNLASGIYFYQLMSGDFTQTKKMILLK